MGWSHGAMSVLWALRPGFLDATPRFKTAIAFYPGCRQIADLDGWRPRVPLTVLIGASDDWTQPGPCRELAERTGFKFIEYPGAYHGFDAPNSKVRVRKGLGAVKSGEAHVGGDPTARAAAIKEVMATLAAALGGP
jgi:dienelactone hydrolase